MIKRNLQLTSFEAQAMLDSAILRVNGTTLEDTEFHSQEIDGLTCQLEAVQNGEKVFPLIDAEEPEKVVLNLSEGNCPF